LGTLFGDLAHQVTTLAQQEIALAKAELGEKVETVQRAGLSVVAGGAVLYAGILVLLLAAVVGLDELLDRWMETNWLAPLIVGLIVTIVGFLMVKGGQKAMKRDAIVPRRTMRSLRRDIETVQSNGAHPRAETGEIR
jgi:xanthine/uracil permease